MEAFWGTLVAAVLTLVGVHWTVRSNTRMARQKAWADYLLERMRLLSEAAAEYDELLNTFEADEGPSSPEYRQRHAAIIGRAIAACRSVPDFAQDGDEYSPLLDLWYEREETNIPEVQNGPGRKVFKIHRLNFIATWRLTPGLVKEVPDLPSFLRLKEGRADDLTLLRNPNTQIRMWGSYQQRNRHALSQAMDRLAVLIADAIHDRDSFSSPDQH